MYGLSFFDGLSTERYNEAVKPSFEPSFAKNVSFQTPAGKLFSLSLALTILFCGF